VKLNNFFAELKKISAPLRGDPRFEKTVASLAPKQVERFT